MKKKQTISSSKSKSHSINEIESEISERLDANVNHSWKCDNQGCSKQFPNEDNLRRHQETECTNKDTNSNYDPEDEEDGEDQEDFICKMGCGKHFGTASALKYHTTHQVCLKKRHTTNENIGTSSSSHEDANIPIPGSPSNESLTDDKPLVCPLGCNKLLGTKQAMKYHVDFKVCLKRKKRDEVKAQSGVHFQRAPRRAKTLGGSKSMPSQEKLYGNENLSCSQNHILLKAPESEKNCTFFLDWEAKALDGVSFKQLPKSLKNAVQAARFHFGDESVSLPAFTASTNKGGNENSGSTFLNAVYPVYAMAASPSSPDILAVGTSPLRDTYTLLGHSSSPENLKEAWLQVWQLDGTPTSSLRYLVEVHNAGVLLALTWMPSKHVSNGLGLLAVVSENGDLRILSMPDASHSTGQYIVANTICVFHQHVLRDAGFHPLCLDWSPVAPYSYLATGLGDGSILVWDMAHAARSKNFGEFACVKKLALSTDSTWVMREGREAISANLGVRKVVFSSVESHLISSLSQDGVVRIWDTRTSVPLLQCQTGIRGHQLVWPRSGDFLVIGDDGGKLHIVEITSGKMSGFSQHNASVGCLHANPDFESPLVLASGGLDGRVCIWLCQSPLGHKLQDGGVLLPVPPPSHKTQGPPVGDVYNNICVEQASRCHIQDDTVAFTIESASLPVYRRTMESDVASVTEIYNRNVEVRCVQWTRSALSSKANQVSCWLVHGGYSGIIRCQRVSMEVVDP